MITFLGLLLLGPTDALAKAPARAEAPLPEVTGDLAAPLPVDPKVRTGTLPNGLTYYVEPNDKPKHRVELRLAVKVGSIVETDAERGIAHFVEHMAFNGTDHFEGNELVAYLESLGAQFGAHLNAYTSFDETVYQLQLPTDRAGLLDSGLLVLSDFAGGITFDAEECEKERGVVLEEWRLGQGLGQRVQDVTLPRMFHGSRYLDRMPIGTHGTLNGWTCDDAKAFWQRWYRPELMAVAVVGDIDPDATVAAIATRFGGLRAQPGAPERVWSSVPDHDETLTVVFTDPEIPQGIVTIGAKVDEVERPDHGAYRDFLLEQMVFFMLNERLAVAAQDPGAPHLAAEAGESGLGHQRALHTVTVLPKEGRVLDALAFAAREVERVHRHGFTADELRRARDLLTRNLQTYYDERDTTESSEHVEEILRVFLTDEPMPGIPYEYALSRAYLPTITLDEANAFAREGMLPDRSRVVQVLLPASATAPAEAELLATLDAVTAEEIGPPEAEAAGSALVAEAPTPGTARRVARDRKLGTTTWLLSNGATVVLKPTTFQADEVVLEAFSPGGTSLVSDADYVPAITATDLARRSGLGEHDAVALARLMVGKDAGLSAVIGRHGEAISGGAAASELETLLQLVHLTFTAPRFDPTALELETQARLEMLRNRDASPDAVFEDRFNDDLWADHPRMAAWTVDDVAKMDLAASERIYRERFGNAGDFTFVLAGNLDEAVVLPLIETWLASLPASPERERWQDDGARRIEGVHTFEMTRGDTPRARMRLLFHGPFDPTPAQRLVLDATAAALETALMDRLREQLGGTYGVSATSGSAKHPVPTYSLRIDFECDPDRLDELRAAVWETIDGLRAGDVSAGLLETLREKNRRWYETAIARNDVWASSLAALLSDGSDPRQILRYPVYNEAVDVDDVVRMAAKVLDKGRYVEAIQRP